MEKPKNTEPLKVNAGGNNDSGMAESLPVEPSAKPDVVAAEMDTTGAVVPLAGTRVTGGDREGEKEEEEAAVGDDFDGSSGGGGDDGGGGGLEGRSEVSVEMTEEEIAGEAVVEEIVAKMVEEAVAGEIPVEETLGEETLVIPRRSGEPKGKGIAMEEPVITSRPVGLTTSDYVVFAYQKDVMERAQENLAVLDAVLEEMREAEIARV